MPIDKGDCQVEQWNHKSSSSNCKIRRVMQTAICTTHGYQAGTSLVAHTSIYEALEKLINRTEMARKNGQSSIHVHTKEMKSLSGTSS